MLPSLSQFRKQKQYRIIPSKFPPINFFEDLVDPDEMETVFEIENLTNERLRELIGDIFLVSHQDRVSGPGSSVVMASFTHIHRPSRFTDGSYGVYYAAFSLETSIRETVYHRELFMRATEQDAGEITMRVYEGSVRQPLHDIRTVQYKNLHDPQDYSASQLFGRKLKESESWGIIYNSVRHNKGTCIAVFRPPAISIPRQTKHLIYRWNGERVTAVLDTQVIFEF